MFKYKRLFGLIFLLWIGGSLSAHQLAVIPFAFYSAEFATAAGCYCSSSDLLQKDTHINFGGITSSNGTNYFFYQMREFKVPYLPRIFFEPNLYGGYFGNIKVFHNPYSTQPYNEQPGHNDSDGDNYFEGAGQDIWLQLKFRYLLPIGHGKTHIKPYQEMDRGRVIHAENGGTSWNPLQSGRTKIDITPFYRSQKDTKNSGIELTLSHENFDFFPNPTCGNQTQFSLIHDLGQLGSDVSWSNWEADYSHYIQLNQNPWYPCVLALNFWTSDSPTWDQKSGNGLYRRPASFARASLGGNERFRAYYSTRFNDRSAIYYGAELRKIAQANPLGNSRVLSRMGIHMDWMQWVLFGEIGRVHRNWNWKALHQNMKGDIGGGIRFLMDQLLLRIDFAYGFDGPMLQMYIDQPF